MTGDVPGAGQGHMIGEAEHQTGGDNQGHVTGTEGQGHIPGDPDPRTEVKVHHPGIGIKCRVKPAIM